MKKSVSYRINQETEQIIETLAKKYHCSKTELLESCIEIVWNQSILKKLDDHCQDRYLYSYGIEMEYKPDITMLLRENYKCEFRIL